MARKSSYTPELAEKVCSLVSQGDNLDRIGMRDGMPCKDTLYEWLRKYPEFSDEYARARAIRADARSDRMDDLGRKVLSGEVTPEQARVLADIEKWQAGKENPKRYGDRVQTEHSGNMNVTVSSKEQRDAAVAAALAADS